MCIIMPIQLELFGSTVKYSSEDKEEREYPTSVSVLAPQHTV